MATVSSISPDPPKNKGLDYVYLRTEGIRLVQALSGTIWTDYNEHDPGVTTLEQLCYALTELCYRAEMPVADILGDPVTGEIHPHLHALFTASRILPCNPVTCCDYRKLIVDRVTGVANAWMHPRIPKTGSREVNGTYDISVYAPGLHHDHGGCGPDPWEKERRLLRRRVRRVYNRHRNLCEDLRAVHILGPFRTVVQADVSVRSADSMEKILAGIFFSLGKLIAPEIRRQPLNALLDEGLTPGEIFNGPLLRNGFIADNELLPPIAEVAVNDLIKVMAQTEGVISVKNVAVRAGHTGIVYGINDTIPVPPRDIPFLDTSPLPEGGFTIRILRNGAVYTPDPDTVRLELSLLWAAYRRTYPLEAQYKEYFPVPRGRKLELEQYYSIQNQYPPIYGIGWYGLPPDSTPARRGQAKQLKGYLLAFEQLMADYLAQLTHVGNLFSLDPEPWRTYYWQSIEKSVPNVDPLLVPLKDYREGVNAIVESEDAILDRRARFTQYLLSLYASQLNSIADDTQCRSDRRSTERLVRARLQLLRVLPESTRRRGTGFDYLAEPSPFNVAGMEIKCSIEAGLDLEGRSSLTDTLKKAGLSLVRRSDSRPVSAPGSRQSRQMEAIFEPIAHFAEPADVPECSPLLNGNSFTENFVDSAQDPSNLFIGRLPEDDSFAVAHRSGIDGSWELIEVLPDLSGALREAHSLCRQLKHIHRSRTQFYIVEHNLLRSGRRKKHDGNFVCSFTITVVVGLPRNERRSRNNRTIIEEIVRENTPAHIVAEICYLDSCNLLKFEDRYHAWRRALRRRKSSRIPEASKRLLRFLEHHKSREIRAQA